MGRNKQILREDSSTVTVRSPSESLDLGCFLSGKLGYYLVVGGKGEGGGRGSGNSSVGRREMVRRVRRPED